MQITTDEKGYVENYAVLGTVDNGRDVAEPGDLSAFERRCQAYRLAPDGSLAFDPARWAELEAERSRPVKTQGERIAELEEALEILLYGGAPDGAA